MTYLMTMEWSGFDWDKLDWNERTRAYVLALSKPYERIQAIIKRWELI
jgi:hypothetical protein